MAAPHKKIQPTSLGLMHAPQHLLALPCLPAVQVRRDGRNDPDLKPTTSHSDSLNGLDWRTWSRRSCGASTALHSCGTWARMAQTMPPGRFLPPVLTQTALLSSSLSKKAAPLQAKKSAAWAGKMQTGKEFGRRRKEDEEPVQNATSRMILAQYYSVEQGNVPVDPRNGLDMRTLCAAQDPSYLHAKEGNTYETTSFARRPYYEGAYVDKLREGDGKCVFGNVYFSFEGEWRKGSMHGHGRFILQDGGFYEGDFMSNEITGSGIRQWADGSQYSGQFREGEMDGQGILLRADGERYEGGWKRNQRSGKGVLVKPNGSRYEGTWEDHRLNGQGRYEGADGALYVGDWFDGNMDGKGELKEANGDHYQGRFMAGRKNGPGDFFHAASGIHYNCDWLNDFPEIAPVQFQAEVEERLEWVPPTLSGQPTDEGSGEEAEAEQEEISEPPPNLAQILEENPITAGEAFPAFVVRVTNEHNQPQDGESGRLLELCAGIFEEILPEPQEGEGEGGNEASAVSSEEDEHAAVVPHYKIHPTPAFPIFIKSPVVEVEVSEEGAGKEEGASSEEPVAEDEEVSKPQQGTLVGIGQEYTLERKYPPQFTLGGLKTTNGQLKVEGLTIPEDTPEGDYRLKISSTYHSPFGDIKPMYVNFKQFTELTAEITFPNQAELGEEGEDRSELATVSAIGKGAKCRIQLKYEPTISGLGERFIAVR